MRKILVIFSGGLDSTVLLTTIARGQHKDGIRVEAIGFNYGQRHVKELNHAKMVANYLGLKFDVVDLSAIGDFLTGSSQTDPSVPVPHGHYAEESMKTTVVPNRNMIMLSVAAGIALSRGLDEIYFAAHGGDHAIYPDCRQEFVTEVNKAVHAGNWERVNIFAPYLDNTKADLVKIGAEVNAPFALTWSCYEGGAKHCGRCGTCVERKESFDLAKVIDPTEYAA